MSCYITQKPETIEGEIEFTPGTKESAAHFSLALARGGLTAASAPDSACPEPGREGAEAWAPGAAAPQVPKGVICSKAKLE